MFRYEDHAGLLVCLDMEYRVDAVRHGSGEDAGRLRVCFCSMLWTL